MIVYESVSAYLLPVAPCTLYSTVSLIKLLGLVLNKEMWITKTISVPPLELKVAPSGFYYKQLATYEMEPVMHCDYVSQYH